jgi:hypothetical protein
LEEKRKIDPHIFKMTLKQVFMDYFFRTLGDALTHLTIIKDEVGGDGVSAYLQSRPPNLNQTDSHPPPQIFIFF